MTVRDTGGGIARRANDGADRIAAAGTGRSESPASDGAAAAAEKRYRPGSLEIFGADPAAGHRCSAARWSRFLGHPVMQSWSTVFVAICVQATPFLVLGVVVSGAIAAFVPASCLHARSCPATPLLAVPVASVCGAALPGCECGSVPISNRLIERGRAAVGVAGVHAVRARRSTRSC